MAGPGVRIHGSASGGSTGGGPRTGSDPLYDAFLRALHQPSSANERLFKELYAARVPHSSLFGAGGGAGGGAQVGSAAAALHGSASSLNAAAQALQRAAAAIAAAGAGGGGRGGGGGRPAGSGGAGGGGGGGGGNVTIGPWAGSGRTPQQIARSMLSAGIMPSMLGVLRRAWPIALAGEMIDAPRQLGALESGVLSMSAPWMKLTRSVFGRGVAGGFSGAELRKLLSPGTTAEPAWMRALGVEPQEVADLLQNFGIPTKSAKGSMDLARTIMGFGASPGFANVPAGALLQAVRQAQGIGIAPPQFLAKLGPQMDEAGQRQRDQTRILASIEGILGRIAASGGAGMTLAGTLRFFSRFNSSGLPGARTGEVQAQTAASLSGVFGNLASSPFAMTVASLGIPRGTLRSAAGLRKLLGGDVFDRLMKSPDTRAMLGDIEALAQGGNRAMALELVGQLISSNPNLAAGIAQRGLRGLVPPHLRGLALSNFTGGNIAAAYALMQPPTSTGTGGATPSFMEGLDILSGQFGFNKGADYAAMLRRAGVPEALIGQFIKAGQIAGLNPLLSAAFAKAEHADFATGKRGGLMGLTGVGPLPASVLAQIVKADRLIKGDLARGGGDVNMARSLYVRGVGESAVSRALDAALGAPGSAAIRSFLANATGISGLPLSVNKARSDVAQQVLSGAQVEFQTLGVNLVEVNTAAHALGGTFDDVAKRLRRTFLPTLDEIQKSDAGWRQWQRDHNKAQGGSP